MTLAETLTLASGPLLMSLVWGAGWWLTRPRNPA